ncbi:hypothetical protein ACHAXM_009946 [Skeletonema potamos]|jgi:predicted unusual protein kinase regulating ubiquinone biosynthesis (AarF/ABC1/UbiB family)
MNPNITNKDIISGQGKDADLHPGNIMFRKVVGEHKQTYARAPNSDKQKISKGIVAALRHFGFNFLKLDTETGHYYDIGDKKAVEKTSQALREKRSNIKQKLAVAAGSMSNSEFRSDTSKEESCVNFSIQLLQSLSEEEQEPDSPSQQETQEKHDVPRRVTLSNRSMSGIEPMSVSENELSTILSTKFGESEFILPLTDEEVEDILKMGFDFSGTDEFSSISMSLGTNENIGCLNLNVSPFASTSVVSVSDGFNKTLISQVYGATVDIGFL